MSAAPTLRRVSASRLSSIDQCTMKFYLNEICGLPEKIWQRTSAGTCCHGILECLYRSKHRAHHDQIKAAQTIYASPAIARLVRAWRVKLNMPDEIAADLDSMCLVALNHTNFLDEGAITRFDPEHEFTMTLEGGAVVRGFIDRLCEMPDRFIIHDYKTARNKHTKAEVANSYQSLCYQLYVWKTFGKLAEVRYYFLRHAPTKLTPAKHMMITPPASAEQLLGFEQYLIHMHKAINAFGMEEAHSGFCQDKGFCDRVCSYRRPFRYWRISKTDTGQTVRSVWIDPADQEDLDIRPQIEYDETVELLTHPGCPRFN